MVLAAGTTFAGAQSNAQEIMALEQAKLIEILKNPEVTEFAKAKACQRLAVIGTKEVVPALAALLHDPKFGHYARFGLEPIPDSSVDDALRDALGKLTGRPQVGVINSIGYRRDEKAVEPLAKLLDDSDAEVATAAAAALGRVSGLQAAEMLRPALRHMKAAVRLAVADACLVCAEGLLAGGNQKEARALYTALLRRNDLPQYLRIAAQRGEELAR